MPYTEADVKPSHGPNGKIIEHTLAEREAIAAEWNAEEAAQQAASARDAKLNLRFNDARVQAMVATLQDATPADIDAFVEGQVANMQDAKNMFKRILLLISAMKVRVGNG